MKFPNEVIKEMNPDGCCYQLSCDSWDEFQQFVNLHWHILKKCIFRGQKKCDWKLQPSIIRILKDVSDIEERNFLINWQLAKFRKFSRGRHKLKKQLFF